eukprot:12330884-Alexandrium_andersonii.AAC.1
MLRCRANRASLEGAVVAAQKSTLYLQKCWRVYAVRWAKSDQAPRNQPNRKKACQKGGDVP